MAIIADPNDRKKPEFVTPAFSPNEIGVTGVEPATSWSRTKRSTKLSYTPAPMLRQLAAMKPREAGRDSLTEIYPAYKRAGTSACIILVRVASSAR